MSPFAPLGRRVLVIPAGLFEAPYQDDLYLIPNDT